MGSSLWYCPKCVGSYDNLLVFWPFWGWLPNCFSHSSIFLLIAFGLPPFYLALLQSWSALHGSLTPAGLAAGSADTSLLRADTLSCKSCYNWFRLWIRTPSLCWQVPLWFWQSRLECFVERFFLYASRPEGHWSLLESCSRCFVHNPTPCPFWSLVEFPLLVFVDILLRTRNICFFHCPLAQSDLDWNQSLLFCPFQRPLLFLFVTYFWF